MHTIFSPFFTLSIRFHFATRDAAVDASHAPTRPPCPDLGAQTGNLPATRACVRLCRCVILLGFKWFCMRDFPTVTNVARLSLPNTISTPTCASTLLLILINLLIAGVPLPTCFALFTFDFHLQIATHTSSWHVLSCGTLLTVCLCVSCEQLSVLTTPTNSTNITLNLRRVYGLSYFLST